MITRLFPILALLVFFCTTPGLRAEGLPAAEKTKIESLLTHVGGLAEAKFIRNGKDYDAKNAAEFLRGKWQANEKQIHSAAEFIAVAATRSSTTGKPYMVQFKGMPPTPCSGYLTAQLSKLEKNNGG